ncbi:MAG TPA: trehalase-like domain-containing protein, partial [Candidatus Polarisedimenticolaceae bacterium]|nr:trehalase-like domain-containing protein [Candidatus Polarisedimenticolaceae bacterium]
MPSSHVSRIQDYGVIGDGRSAALVSREGSIDWLCWPRFDSPSVFAAVLDPVRGGAWRIAPTGPFRSHQAYAEDSNVLVTTFETTSGRARLTDFMTAISEEEKRRMLVPEHQLLRILEGVEGEVALSIAFQPRPDYGRMVLPLRDAGELGLRLEYGAHLYTLQGQGALEGDVVLRAGERRSFSLTFHADGPAVLPPLGALAVPMLERTARWWRGWSSRCTYQGPHRTAVMRSLLALKLLSYAPTGAIVAAPTTSLPERIGGDLNWDYRYCWLRDA